MSLDLELYSQLSSSRSGENLRLRSFLKTRDAEEVDKVFREAHEDVFNRIICSECRNCCKSYELELSESELNTISKFSGIDKSIAKADEEGNYIIDTEPCIFLKENICSIEKCKPKTCRDYPGTDKPGRVWRLLSIIDKSLVCPAVFEILEYVKEEYRFIHEMTPLIYFFDSDKSELWDEYFDSFDEIANEPYYFEEDEEEDLIDFTPLRAIIDTGKNGIIEVTVAESPYELLEVLSMCEEYELNKDKAVLDKYCIGLSTEEKLLKLVGIQEVLSRVKDSILSMDQGKRNKEIKNKKKQKKKSARKSTRKNRK